MIIAWRSHAPQPHATLMIGVEGRQRKRAFTPHALLLLDPAEAEPGLAACNARMEFEAERPSYATATTTYPVSIEGAVSICAALPP
ncbi:hypothetical protein PQR65_00835 [Paraburkholderia nemoris]|uniref:hypothetical protein n=1 Tax=Paraburkholderia nemoris TaxID=2793076 RepID=UPI0038B7821A